MNKGLPWCRTCANGLYSCWPLRLDSWVGAAIRSQASENEFERENVQAGLAKCITHSF